LFLDIVEHLKKNDMDDVLVIGGGIIPEEDVPGLNAAGIKGIFGPGTPLEDIIRFIKENVKG
ncbi:MAG: cobalamin B12-binding domain-containing protein, partial [Thermoplasmatota archaeon]